MTVWQHLKHYDQWAKPQGVRDDQAFLMVQCMESWFLADRETLATFFGKGFKTSAIRQWPNLESVGKEKSFGALKSATARCEHKLYEKGKVSFELLGQINPAKVEQASKHAKELLEQLRPSS